MLTEKFKYQAAVRRPFFCLRKKLTLSVWLFFSLQLTAQNLYFPPIQNNQWDTISPSSLGWCEDKIPGFYQFLDNNHTKAFLLLKDGKIVMEKYFQSFTQDSFWYWASAAKSLTATLIGKANENKLLSLADSAVKFLGSGFTSCTPLQENAITIKHLITMTSGLDDGVTDNHCTLPQCLTFKAKPGTRWAYHNAPYTLLDSVIQKVSGISLNAFTNQVVEQKTGINGLWIKNGWNNLYVSNARSFARFGLLAQNNFVWQNDTILMDSVYINQMLTSSQNINPAYGYLWWLNGTTQHMLPQTQWLFNGSIAPDAPKDMVAAIGKNGQISSISKKEGLVLIRMGDAPGTDVEVPTAFCNLIWQKLNDVRCTTGQYNIKVLSKSFTITPNPANYFINVNLSQPAHVVIIDALGKPVLEVTTKGDINIAELTPGCYYLKLQTNTGYIVQKWIKL